MPTMTNIHIVILFADAAEQPTQLPYLVTQAIRVVESPPAGSRAFALRVSEGGHEWEALLSAEDSRLCWGRSLPKAWRRMWRLLTA